MKEESNGWIGALWGQNRFFSIWKPLHLYILWFRFYLIFKWRDSMYTVRSIIFNLDHEINSFYFISNGNDHIPVWSTLVSFYFRMGIFFCNVKLPIFHSEIFMFGGYRKTLVDIFFSFPFWGFLFITILLVLFNSCCYIIVILVACLDV